MAVLGILAINIAGFAGPIAATDTPALPHCASGADEIAFALTFVVFEGKMRALFSLLFGASMLLFIERIDARTRAGGPFRDGEMMQLRRLGWLALFGWLHYILLWWGDILFVYAACGFLALGLRRLPLRAMVAGALLVFAAWHGWGMINSLPQIRAEEQVALGTATLAERAAVSADLADTRSRMAADMAQARLGFGAMAADKLATAPSWPVVMTLYTMGETLPLMLIGMALYRSGFFAGAWPRRWIRTLAGAGLATGTALTLVLLGWAAPRHFPPGAMPMLLSYWAGPAHLLMALGYAAVLVMAAPRLARGEVGQRLIAVGRMAFSNYLGTSMVMTAIFYGWGLGLIGQVSRAEQMWFVLGGWALMLGWSRPWLARFRQGPLEWLWRSLTEWRVMPMRKTPAPPLNPC